jgi:hypothetical protein
MFGWLYFVQIPKEYVNATHQAQNYPLTKYAFEAKFGSAFVEEDVSKPRTNSQCIPSDTKYAFEIYFESTFRSLLSGSIHLRFI